VRGAESLADRHRDGLLERTGTRLRESMIDVKAPPAGLTQ